ncbi:hypothetical protein B1207_03970 [Legionella quinlivanii]|uniref:Uncharacterized protein n=1 Tax=Legionella quinlivanii TaxID=45073 RepID=A0A364LKR8_9GAMM|nr:hypothetical protein [Legionella quinlivanii]RAP37340.1 hypothetical protein B1207_03970 [Legionella quinlivanii]
MPTRQPQKFMPNNGRQRYLISKKSFDAIQEYQQQLAQGKAEPGIHMRAAINYFLAEGQEEYNPGKAFSPEDLKKIGSLKIEDFAQLIMNTRKNWIFAERVKIGDNQAWNAAEFKILSTVGSVIENATVYDNGRHSNKQIQGDARYADNPHKVHLLCVPGAILDERSNPVDAPRIIDTKEDGTKVINQDKYNEVYMERLEIMFAQANELGKQEGRKALVTIPGIGNGVFAGAFAGRTIPNLQEAITATLKAHPEWEHIGCVWLDGWKSDVVADVNVGNTLLRVRNSGGENGDKKLYSGQPFSDLGQLSKAEEFAESAAEHEQFKGYCRCKIFAWDPFSYEGNDWVKGDRITDEGCIAATDAHAIMSGIEGSYKTVPGNKREKAFQPEGFETWDAAFTENNLKQSIADRLFVYNDKALVKSHEASSSFEQDLLKNIRHHTPGKPFLSQHYAKADWPYVAQYILANENSIRAKTNAREASHILPNIVKEAAFFDQKALASISHSYAHGANGGRHHLYNKAAAAEGMILVKAELHGLRGDALKRGILDAYKEKIAACNSKEELDDLRKTYDNSDDKKIIETSQGLMTSIRKLETSSQKEMNQMFESAEERVKEFESDYKPSVG